MTKRITLFFLAILVLCSLIFRSTIERVYAGYKLQQHSKNFALLYKLEEGAQFQDISQKLINDQSAPPELKEPLMRGERRIYIFKYLSDGNEVAGYMSYLQQGTHPTLVFLRGGNDFLGIMRPNNRFSLLKNYNVIGTLYRGNIYGGEDELGGKDILDVENLMKFIPTLEKLTHTTIQTPHVMMGGSRGAMEMFLALAKSEYVKSRITHAISISGMTDANLNREQRAEMKYLYWRKFRNSHEASIDQWISARNPVEHAGELSKSLKVLMIYGLEDKLVSLEMQEHLKQALEHAGITATLVTVPGADHGFINHFSAIQDNLNWFLLDKNSKKV